MLAEQYAAEALSDETELTVTDVAVAPDGAGARLTVGLNWEGEDLTVDVMLEG